MLTCVCLSVCVCMYVHREREKERGGRKRRGRVREGRREIDRETGKHTERTKEPFHHLFTFVYKINRLPSPSSCQSYCPGHLQLHTEDKISESLTTVPSLLPIASVHDGKIIASPLQRSMSH